MSEKWIQASEVADFVYCNRSWWLKRSRGVGPGQTKQIVRGNAHHKKHGRMLHQSLWARRTAYALLFVAVAYVTFHILVNL